MNRIEEGLSEIKRMFREIAYPSAFTSKYDQLECLAQSHGTETFLVCAKADAALYVAKCYDKTVFTVVNERSILSQLRHEGLPEYVDCFGDDDSCVTVRSYIAGTPLDVYAERNKLTEKQTVEFCIQLCDILEYLQKALQRSDGRRKKRLLLATSFLLTAIIFLCAGFMVGRYTTLLTPETITQYVSFTEPLIESQNRLSRPPPARSSTKWRANR